MAGKRQIRVLVIDDSAYNRMTLSDIINQEQDMRVVGKACDGEEGLEMALRVKPDVITLDLEMPRMGGFPFLRILMSKRPTPVVVISSHAEPDKVFRALELGALDFVAKPTKSISPAIANIAEELVSKVRAIGGLRRDFHRIPKSDEPANDVGAVIFPDPRSVPPGTGRRVVPRVVAIAASTGGPQALTQVLESLPGTLPAAIVIVQHMPPKFTTNFAERLNKLCQLGVVEPTETQPLMPGTAYISPGAFCLEVSRTNADLVAKVLPPNGSERIVPSADRLFQSVAKHVGKDALGIVLTGMGNDGSVGAKALAEAGGVVIAEDENTAVVPGMPSAAIATGAVQYIAPLHRMANHIIDFCRMDV
jgi:two-component system, chemotaxis family, protein-glutamate methylesterase/glutaminase